MGWHIHYVSGCLCVFFKIGTMHVIVCCDAVIICLQKTIVRDKKLNTLLSCIAEVLRQLSIYGFNPSCLLLLARVPFNLSVHWNISTNNK